MYHLILKFPDGKRSYYRQCSGQRNTQRDVRATPAMDVGLPQQSGLNGRIAVTRR